MLAFVYILVLYAAHVLLVHVLKGLKNTVASGIDFSLTGAFLAGYFFGWKWGFIIGVIFGITNNIVQMEFFPSLMFLVPMTGVMGIWGALTVVMGWAVLPAVLVGVVFYALITDALMMFILGERDYVMMGSFFIGSLVINWIFFDVFF